VLFRSNIIAESDSCKKDAKLGFVQSRLVMKSIETGSSEAVEPNLMKIALNCGRKKPHKSPQVPSQHCGEKLVVSEG
jgi:hypothetical protein